MHFCKELYIIVLEDDYHFLMLCPAYTELRSNYTSYSSSIEILTETEEHKIKKLASFVYHTDKLLICIDMSYTFVRFK